MENLLLLLAGLSIVGSNVIAFVVFKRKRNLYLSAFIILLLSVILGPIEGALALYLIRDGFAAFFGWNIAFYLFINSVIVFIVAMVATAITKVKQGKM